MARISVIIPVYNSEEYLDKCLGSVLGQTFEDFEIIAVNDGSTDSSLEILLDYASRYGEKIKVITQENAGQSAARNRGLEEATGEFISFVDSDDYIALDTFEKTVGAADEKGADVVCFGIFKDTNGELSEHLYAAFDFLTTELKYILHEASPCNKLIRRSLFADNNLKFTEGIIYEDFELIPQLLLYTKKIAYVDERLYYYVIHDSSTMRQMSYSPKLKCIFRVVETLRDKFYNTEYKTELEYLYITHLLHDAAFRFLQFEEGRQDITKIGEIMRKYFPRWRKNKYYKECAFKYKVFCELVYFNQFSLLRQLLHIK